MNPNIGTRPEQLVEDLARRSELEQLVARISRSFVGTAAGELSSAIDRTLE